MFSFWFLGFYYNVSKYVLVHTGLPSSLAQDSRSAKTLIIRPTMLGTSSIATFCSLFVAILSFMVIPFDNLLLGWVIFSVLFLSLGHFAARSLRSYFAAVESSRAAEL